MHSFAVYGVWYRQMSKSNQTEQYNRSLGSRGGVPKVLWVGIGCFVVYWLAKDGGCGGMGDSEVESIGTYPRT